MRRNIKKKAKAKRLKVDSFKVWTPKRKEVATTSSHKGSSAIPVKLVRISRTRAHAKKASESSSACPPRLIGELPIAYTKITDMSILGICSHGPAITFYNAQAKAQPELDLHLDNSLLPAVDSVTYKMSASSVGCGTDPLISSTRPPTPIAPDDPAADPLFSSTRPSSPIGERYDDDLTFSADSLELADRSFESDCFNDLNHG